MAFTTYNVINVTNDNSTWIEQETSQTYDMPNGLQTFIMYIISFGAILNNLMVFYTLPRLKKKIKDSTRSAMLNLAVTDTLLGVGGFISRTVYVISPEAFFKHLCAVDAYFNLFLAGMSIFGLGFLNLDKFLTLAFPLRYAIHMTSKKAAAILIAIWITLLIFYVSFNASLSTNERYLENTFICFGHHMEDTAIVSALKIVYSLLVLILPVAVCIISLIGICCVMKRHRARSEGLHEGQQRPSPNIGKTSVWSILALNFTFFFMIMPFIVCHNIWKLVTGDTAGPDAYFVTVWLVAANSAVNPLIYIPTMRSYRKELMAGLVKLFKGKCKIGKLELLSGNSVDMSNKKKTDSSDVGDGRL